MSQLIIYESTHHNSSTYQLIITLNQVITHHNTKSFMNVTTPLGLCSNVIYEFTCSCDANLTYIGMSTRHLSTRAKEHLDFNSQVSSAIKNHIMCCNVCSSVKLNLNSFKIIKKCKSEFHTKIHEALFIKKRNPGLNRQLYANGSSFLLNVF